MATHSNKISLREIILFLVVVAVGGLLVKWALEPRRMYQERTQCLSNLQQIGIAMRQYAEDNADHFPRAWYGRDPGPSSATGNYKWMDVLFPYVKRESVFTCPSDPRQQIYRYRHGTDYGSYVFNNAY